MTAETWIAKPYLPSTANHYCFQLWKEYRFSLKITTPRKSKLGDYRFNPRNESHQITINNNLNRFAFLIVYLHEVAHCTTNIKFGTKHKPHGKLWQQEMRSVLHPLLSTDVFPVDINEALVLYLKSPKAANCTDPVLTRALRKYDPQSSDIPLEQIEEGNEFLFRSKRYRKLKLRRTRVFCQEMESKRTYLISNLALVRPLV